MESNRINSKLAVQNNNFALVLRKQHDFKSFVQYLQCGSIKKLDLT